MATEETKKKDQDKVIEGADVTDRTAIDQAKEARGEDEKVEDTGGKVDSKVTAAAKEATTPEMALADAAKAAKRAHYEAVGIDPDAAETGANAGGIHKVEDANTKEPMYTGVVTVTGVDGQYHKLISTRIDCTSAPKGEAWLKYAFKQHFPSADLDAGIKVDPKNEADPMLRTQHG